MGRNVKKIIKQEKRSIGYCAIRKERKIIGHERK